MRCATQASSSEWAYHLDGACLVGALIGWRAFSRRSDWFVALLPLVYATLTTSADGFHSIELHALLSMGGVLHRPIPQRV